MRAVLFCRLDVFSHGVHELQDVFVMPAGALEIRHISSPCASCESPLAISVCRAIANQRRGFSIDDRVYTIMNHKTFDHEYVRKYKDPPKIDFTAKPDKTVTIHVFEWRTYCSLQEHKINDVHAIILNLKTNEPVTVNAFYCPICDRYWLHKSALEEYQKRGWFLNARFRYYNPWGESDYGLQRESTLRQYGYNVRIGGMQSWERHRLLAALIEFNLLTRRQILEHLHFCIYVPGSRPGMEESCTRWIEDMRFVNNLPIDTDKTVYGNIDKL